MRLKKEIKKSLSKKKHKNGCNILIVTFTNLKNYVYFKKCLKQRRQPPLPLTPPSSKVEGKSHLATAVILGRPATIPNKLCDWLGKQ